MKKLFYTVKDLAEIYDRSESFAYTKMKELQVKQKELEPNFDQVNGRISKYFFHKITGIPTQEVNSDENNGTSVIGKQESHA